MMLNISNMNHLLTLHIFWYHRTYYDRVFPVTTFLSYRMSFSWFWNPLNGSIFTNIRNSFGWFFISENFTADLWGGLLFTWTMKIASYCFIFISQECLLYIYVLISILGNLTLPLMICQPPTHDNSSFHAWHLILPLMATHLATQDTSSLNSWHLILQLVTPHPPLHDTTFSYSSLLILITFNPPLSGPYPPPYDNFSLQIWHFILNIHLAPPISFGTLSLRS